jgi:hypothetical protein
VKVPIREYLQDLPEKELTENAASIIPFGETSAHILLINGSLLVDSLAEVVEVTAVEE